jgi:hypothetical protein
MQGKQVKGRPIDQRYTNIGLVDFNPAQAPDPELTTQPDPQPATPPPTAARRGAFVLLPVSWMDRLHGAGGPTWDIATHLLLRSFKEHRQTIRLANVALASIGVTKKQKWRALAELEQRGLIHIDHRLRRSPDVTLLYPKEAGK